MTKQIDDKDLVEVTGGTDAFVPGDADKDDVDDQGSSLGNDTNDMVVDLEIDNSTNSSDDSTSVFHR